MATLTQHLLEMNVELARFDPTIKDMLVRYLFDFMLIARRAGGQGSTSR